MDFIIFRADTGRIDSVRAAGGVITSDGILLAAFGAAQAGFGAIPYDGSDLTGKMVDVAAADLVDDPAYVPPVPPAPTS